MGDAVDQEATQVSTALRMDAGLYQVFADVDPTGLDDDATRLLEHTLRDFRRAGVDKDVATREGLAAINDEMFRYLINVPGGDYIHALFEELAACVLVRFSVVAHGRDATAAAPTE